MDGFTFFTIDAQAESEYKVLCIKFLSFSFPVSSAEEVKEKLEKCKKKYFDATHICYAYRLGAKGEIWKAFDAGEPPHVAGDPIFRELRAKNITNVRVVAVLYFGGTKLGAGGLVSAYKTAAELALNQCKIIQRELTADIELFFEYRQM